MLRRKLIAIALLTLATTALTANQGTEPQQIEPSFKPFTGAITGSKVRMRTSPALEGHVFRETLEGEMLAVMGEVSDFYAVAPPEGAKGYVFRTFVLDGVIEGERVNVRLYPDIEAPVLTQLNTGDHVDAEVCEVNNKWLEITLPTHAHFYIAKDFVENRGPIELLADVAKRHHEATHHLSAAFLFAQAEIQKPFAQIDFDAIGLKFAQLMNTYRELPDIANQAEEAGNLLQEIYIQKKIAFLESHAERKPNSPELSPTHLERLAELGIQLQPLQGSARVSDVASAATETVGFSLSETGIITNKMATWQPLEEAIYHLWAAANGEGDLQDFYEEESSKAVALIGVVEHYTRPVKNLPGDYLLKMEDAPGAFIYSTRVNLENLVGKKVVLMGSERPNNNFAFPAYHVLSVE